MGPTKYWVKGFVTQSFLVWNDIVCNADELGMLIPLDDP